MKQKNNTWSRDKPSKRTIFRYDMEFGIITQGILNTTMNIFESFSSQDNTHFQ